MGMGIGLTGKGSREQVGNRGQVWQSGRRGQVCGDVSARRELGLAAIT